MKLTDSEVFDVAMEILAFENEDEKERVEKYYLCYDFEVLILNQLGLTFDEFSNICSKLIQLTPKRLDTFGKKQFHSFEKNGNILAKSDC
jgi:hypothetical protein